MKEKMLNYLTEGGLAVIPTDTIYGIVGQALNKKTIERLYVLRHRSPNKPFIILIASIEDLKLFKIELTTKQKDFLETHWPEALSVVLPTPKEKWRYLHRGTKTLAFRLPKDKGLQKILVATGPLAAPSANLEGQPPATTLTQAKKYFGDSVIYEKPKSTKSKPSTLIKLYQTGRYKILRAGSYQLP